MNIRDDIGLIRYVADKIPTGIFRLANCKIKVTILLNGRNCVFY
ncbi:hypothetical protein MSIBF_A2000002 [groundwater metagenome]|uniref:Uncharacterized protein n=1 Tax=groundwater metagenome TaxID=717931 RepID=A0A098E9G3_9ZZZZ